MAKQKKAKTKLTITDIAKEAGLSISTVSRVLNGKAEKYRIGKKSQKKVKEVAKELNYIPNQFAVNLRSGKSKTIALMVPSLSNPFFAQIASKINYEVKKRGYIVIIGDSNEDQEIEKIELQQLTSRNIEGLIIVPCGNQFEHINLLYNRGMPVVCVDRYFQNLEIPFVSTDNYYGAYLATQYLIDNGHRDIVCIQGVIKSNTNQLRVDGFVEALKKAGINKPQIVGNDFTARNGYLETKRLLKKGHRPTAILTLSNTVAMGCMSALKEKNVLIPDEISLITFDDHPYLDFLATPLSCISQSVKNISKLAVKSLFSRIKDEGVGDERILLKPEIKVRKSVRKIA